MIKHFSENDDLKELIKDGNILVDFYADWCGPCKMLGQTLENIGFADVIKINVDAFPDIAKEYGVMSIPALFAYKNNELVNKSIGLISVQEIEDMFKD